MNVHVLVTFIITLVCKSGLYPLIHLCYTCALKCQVYSETVLYSHGKRHSCQFSSLSSPGSRAQSPSSEDKPSSPFDIAKLQEFGAAMYDNLSPVGSPTRTQERAMHHYSRHSRRSSSHTDAPAGEGLSIPATHGPYGAMTHTSSSSLGSAGEDVAQARSSRTEEGRSLLQGAQEGGVGQGAGKTLDDVVMHAGPARLVASME